MKNKKLLKTLGITFAIVVLLTWIIPSYTVDGTSVKISPNIIQPAGIWDWLNDMGITISYFWQGGLFLLTLGGFYGVLNKTGVLKRIVNGVTKSFKGSEHWFLIITTAVFMIVSALTGIYLPLFIFVPIFIAIILAMNYNKVVALTTTVGAIIIGNISVIYNTDIIAILKTSKFINIWYEIILLVVALALTIFYVLKTGKDKKDKEEIDKSITFVEKSTDAKGSHKVALWPAIVIFSIIFVLLILGLVPFDTMTGKTIFSQLHTNIIGFKLGKFAIFNDILGNSILGLNSWTIVDMMVILLIAAFFAPLFYKIKYKDAFEGFIDGAKGYLSAAFIVCFINVIVVLTLNSGFFTNIMHFVISLTGSLNIFLMSILTFIGSALSIDNLYVANYNMSVISNLLKAGSSMQLLSLIQQAMYGIAMLVAPTSVVLLAGLAYLEVPYTKWLKYIWRLFLLLLIAIFIVLIVASTLIK